MTFRLFYPVSERLRVAMLSLHGQDPILVLT